MQSQPEVVGLGLQYKEFGGGGYNSRDTAVEAVPELF